MYIEFSYIEIGNTYNVHNYDVRARFERFAVEEIVLCDSFSVKNNKRAAEIRIDSQFLTVRKLRADCVEEMRNLSLV